MRASARVPVVLLTLLSTGFVPIALGAEGSAAAPKLDRIERKLEALSYELDALRKRVDDLLWFDRVGDVAHVDKVFIPTVIQPRSEETYGISNERHPFKMWSYVFTPRAEAESPRPLLLLPHGGVHGDFNTYYTHIVRELVELGYVIVAPEYRGSTGYGRAYKESIDYGGLEVDDVVAARQWALDTLPDLDEKRVGILGWSHGGLIALLAAFDHAEKFSCAYAGVPVSDLVARMGYQTQDSRELYEAEHHVGRSAYEDVEEYRRRSPAWNAEKLEIPLLIHTSTNDRDVHVLDVEHLIKSLKAAGKEFRYRIYEDAPGGHSFNRMDTPLALESRREIYEFLGEHL